MWLYIILGIIAIAMVFCVVKIVQAVKYNNKQKSLAGKADENYTSQLGGCTIKYSIKELTPENGRRRIKIAQTLYNGILSNDSRNRVVNGMFTVVSQKTGQSQSFSCDWSKHEYGAMTTALLVLPLKFQKGEDLTIQVKTNWIINGDSAVEECEMEHRGY